MDEQTRLLVVKARLDPASTVPITDRGEKWCRAVHPSSKIPFVCSREKGHAGWHFAQYPNTGIICKCDPNPWE